ncbi:MAG: LPXTG cell wall anchor domain-containing protein [Lachnospiraceae bacterium]|nr:LPXTG cell wall anchor domain-containing protein [Lachnospiraceae bacterium]
MTKREKKSRIIRQLVWLWAVWVLAAALSWTGVSALAAGFDTAVDMGRTDVTLTISYLYGTETEETKNLALENVTFTVFRVADLSPEGVFSLTDSFQGCGVEAGTLNQLDHASEEKTVIGILTSYAESSVEEYWQAVTDENGRAVISSLPVGLYLVTCEELTTETAVYTGSPALISIPTADMESMVWNYQATIQVKPEKTDLETLTTEEPSEPEKPSDTEEPSEPEAPSDTEEPSNTEEPSGSSEPEESSDTEETPEPGETPEHLPSPQTGDRAPLMALLAFLLLCGLALIVLFLYKRKQK